MEQKLPLMRRRTFLATIAGATGGHAVSGGAAVSINPTTAGLADKPSGPVAVDAGAVEFLQRGAGALPRSLRDKLGEYRSVKDFGAVGDGTTDDTRAIQAAIDSFSSGNGAVFIPPGTYKVTSTVIVARSRVSLFGAGKYATRILFAPSASSTCIKYAAGTSVIYQFAIRDLAFYSTDSTYTKVALEVVDASTYVVENITVGGSIPVEGTSFWSGDGSIGIKVRGREAGCYRDIDICADRPLLISDNPNATNDIDHHNFQNLYLTANANPCVEIASGVNLFDVTFDGYQAWVKGTYGLYWVDTATSQVSLNLSIKNVRTEQGTDAAAQQIMINHNYQLSGLIIENMYGGIDRNGILLRRCSHVTLIGVSYVSPSKIALNLDATVAGIRAIGCFWQTGSTARITGQRFMWAVPPATPNALMPDFYCQPATRMDRSMIVGGALAGEVVTIENAANAQIGASDQVMGFLMISDSEGLSAIFALTGHNHLAHEISDPAGAFSNAANMPASTNVYSDGAGAYRIQNKRGTSRKYKYTLLGSYTAF